LGYEFVASRLLSVHVEPDDFERFISSSHFTFSLELEYFCSNKIREMQKQQGQSGKRQAKNAGGAVFSEIERESLVFLEARRGKGLQSSDQICHGRKKSGVSLVRSK